MNKKTFSIIFGICLVLMLSASVAEAENYGNLKGSILIADGQAMSRARVCIYDVNLGPNPFSRQYWRRCDYVSRTADDGSFNFKLPEGRYYLMITRKTTGEKAGPPILAGDMIWPPWDGSESKIHLITAEGPTDIGTVKGVVQFKEEWLAMGKTAIEGRVLLKDGTPAEGVIVYASGDPKIRDLVFISDQRTGADGKYIVRVDEDGKYYVRALGEPKVVEKAIVHLGETTKDIEIRVKENPGRPWDNDSKKKLKIDK